MKESQADGPMADLDLALFQVGGVHYGVEAGQVAGTEVFQGPETPRVRWFHEIMGYPDSRVRYRDPVVLTLQGAAGRIVVDRLEHLARVPLCDLRPFPPLAAPAARIRGLWAVVQRREHMVLLVDFELLSPNGFPLQGS
jgi:chemotaxis signal transduction protein